MTFGSFATAAQAQPTVVLAPPVKAANGATVAPLTGAAAQSVFQWQDVPMDRRVPITRAFFDQGGYQLIDDVGETIVVPFVGKNLFVMRFGHSSSDMYFVNDGSVPTLYVPEGGFLENSAAQGARWYPFPKDFHASVPVYIGFAPTWDDYEADVWYPKTIVYGGYWHWHPWHPGAAFQPTPGYGFHVGDHSFHDWHDYHQYAQTHPAPRRFAQYGPLPDNYHVPSHGPGSFGHHDNGQGNGQGHGHDAHLAPIAAAPLGATPQAGSPTKPAFTAPLPARTETLSLPPAAKVASAPPVSAAAFAPPARATAVASAAPKAADSKESSKDSSKDSASDSAKTDTSSGDASATATTPASASALNFSVTTVPLPPFGFRPLFFRTTAVSSALPTAANAASTTTAPMGLSERREFAAGASRAAFRAPTPTVRRGTIPPLDLLGGEPSTPTANRHRTSATGMGGNSHWRSWYDSDGHPPMTFGSSSHPASFRGGSDEGGDSGRRSSRSGHSGFLDFGRKALGAIADSVAGGGGRSHGDSSSDRGSRSHNDTHNDNHSESRSPSHPESHRDAGSSADSDRPHHK